MGSDPIKVMASGDWHGNPRFAESTIEYAKQNGVDVVMQVGDFGFWTPGVATDSFLFRVEKAARNAGLRVYWLDGNHEDHSRRVQFNDPVNRPNTIYLPRGHRWTWWGKRFAAVGGAVSVDKLDRIPGRSWWPEEELTEDELAFVVRDDQTPVDVVFAHDCPAGVHIPSIGCNNDERPGWPPPFPPKVLAQADFHRGKMRVIADKLNPQVWIHGHYHIPYRLSAGSTEFIGLGCDMDLFVERTVCFIGQDLGVSLPVE